MSLIIRGMQAKITIRYHLTLVRMAIIKKSTNNKCWRKCEEKGALLHTVGGNVNWYSHYGDQYGGSLKMFLIIKKKNTLKVELPYDPAIPLLGIYSEKALI